MQMGMLKAKIGKQERKMNDSYDIVKRHKDIMKASLIAGPAIIILFMLFAPLFSRGGFGHSRERARKVSCASNEKQLGLAMMMYAGDHEAAIPDNGSNDDSMTLLIDNEYIVYGDVFMCPSTGNESIVNGIALDDETEYVYWGDDKSLFDNDSTPETTEVLADNIENHDDYRNFLYVDGHVEGIEGEW